MKHPIAEEARQRVRDRADRFAAGGPSPGFRRMAEAEQRIAALDEPTRQRIRHLYWMVTDAMRHAEALASRACEATEGTDAMLAFEQLRQAMAVFQAEAPALNAIRDMTLPRR